MTLSIRNYLMFALAYDEGKNVRFKIKSKWFRKTEKEVLDKDGNQIYTVKRIPPTPTQNSNSVIYCINSRNKNNIARASVIFDTGQKYKALFKLPPVKEIRIQSIYGNIRLNRIQYRMFSIMDNKKVMGRIQISGLQPLIGSVVFCESFADRQFLASLYVLAIFAMHEDDLIVV